MSALHPSRLEFKPEELLASPKLDAPLIAGGVRCHGGFDADGRYVSPRTLWRNPAVKAWQEQHLATSPHPLVEIPKDAIPPHLPSVAQAKLLLKEGVREPMVRTLTEIAIIEGFGATIRELPVPPLASFIREDVTGTALNHLTSGLFEAHARDEAGWGDEGGHKQMWEAARDLALSNPKVPGDILMAIMGRRGGNARGGRALPQFKEEVERVLGFMTNVLIIEIFAASTFRWAEEVLSDPEVSDAPKEAADMVRHIRADESPHVEYLRTALSEVSARTLIAEDGSTHSGHEIVQGLINRTLGFMIRQRGADRRQQLHASIRASANGIVKDVEDLIQRFDALETPWQPPARFAA
ncbi:MAG: hypothetical protein JO167_04515 [Alphaproteobacteria bacterium]|nr:hypothetical protein [Alphaproteobacteria bacterium]